MKTRCIFLFALVTCLAAKAQITELPIIIKGKEIVYADKKLLYAFDSEAFYRYEDTATQRFSPVPYKCDTVKWEKEYIAPAKFYGSENQRLCQFSDKLNGIILKRKTSDLLKGVALKTTDGGKNWTLLHELPDSVGLSGEVAFHNFDNYIIGGYSQLCLYRNGQFTKLKMDTDHNSYQAEYGNGVFSLASTYLQKIHVSIDEGLSWTTYSIPMDTTIEREYRHLGNQRIVNGKVYFFDLPSPYNIPEITKRSYLTIIDPTTKKRTQKRQSSHFDYMLVDRKGDPYYALSGYKAVYPHTNSMPYTLHLQAKDTTIITSRVDKVNHIVEYFHGNNWNVVRFNDSTLYVFDHPDCENIDLKEAKVENNWMKVEVGVTADIEPVHYPYLIALDAKKGDTTSIMCCRYLLDRYYIDDRKDPYDGKIIKHTTSDSVLILLSQLHRSSSMCVTHTTFKTVEAPLSFEARESNETTLHLFPNPSSDFMQVSNASQVFDLKIVNDMGQIVMQKNKLAPQDRIDIRDLDTGHYSILITFEKDTSLRFSFLKQ